MILVYNLKSKFQQCHDFSSQLFSAHDTQDLLPRKAKSRLLRHIMESIEANDKTPKWDSTRHM